MYIGEGGSVYVWVCVNVHVCVCERFRKLIPSKEKPKYITIFHLNNPPSPPSPSISPDFLETSS